MTTVKQLIEELQVKIRKAVEANDPKRSNLGREYALQVKALPNPEDEIAEALEYIARNHLNQMSSEVEVIDWIVAGQMHPSTKYIDSLHAMLERDDPFIWHEGIVEILYDLKDERSIPSLVKALEYEYPNDPDRELANKILNALNHIGTPESRSVLQKCLESPVSQIREEAYMLLRES